MFPKREVMLVLQIHSDNFFATVPPFTRFSEVANPTHYRRLPDDWIVGVADVVDSTGAIARGAYKAVNMVGASIIAALLNRLGHREFPFVFGGDGAAFALPSHVEAEAREVAAAVQGWAREDMGLVLRVSLVPVQAIRRAGHDVLVARFAVAPDLAYAMFAGGGIHWAETEMKAGNYRIAAAPAGTRPDLSGLSCRWEPIAAERGEIVSVLVLPQPNASARQFAGLISEITGLVGEGDQTRPLNTKTLRFGWPPAGLRMETLAARGRRPFILHYAGLALFSLLGWVLFRFNLTLGKFDPDLYRADTVRNSDFRKFDDGLKLTLDLDAPRLEQLAGVLEKAKGQGIAFYGLHRQTEALMTCIVPSTLMRDHLHFIDGAGGGYATAAEHLKEQMRSG
jgi:hypothetical protein